MIKCNDKFHLVKYIKITLVVLIALSASRFIPHPPNYTSLIALSFYIPAFFGTKYTPIVVISLFFTDLIIGLHSTVLFTWGSVLLIGLISKYLKKSLLSRMSGALLGAIIFFVLTNFGVWINGAYGYTLHGFLTCYLLALPFFAHTLVSTIVFSFIIEFIFNSFKLYKKSFFNSFN